MYFNWTFRAHEGVLSKHAGTRQRLKVLRIQLPYMWRHKGDWNVDENADRIH